MKILSNAKFNELNKTIEDYEKEIFLKEKRLLNAIEREEKLKTEKKCLEESLETKNQLLQKKEQDIDIQSKKLIVANGKIGGYTQSNNRLQKTIEGLEKIKQELESEIQKLNQENGNLKEKLLNFQNKIQDLENKNQNFKEEFKKIHVPKKINEYDKKLKIVKR